MVGYVCHSDLRREGLVVTPESTQPAFVYHSLLPPNYTNHNSYLKNVYHNLNVIPTPHKKLWNYSYAMIQSSYFCDSLKELIPNMTETTHSTTCMVSLFMQ
jgi:hypothetical protein